MSRADGPHFLELLESKPHAEALRLLLGWWAAVHVVMENESPATVRQAWIEALAGRAKSAAIGKRWTP